jgi:hypothetical protein
MEVQESEIPYRDMETRHLIIFFGMNSNVRGLYWSRQCIRLLYSLQGAYKGKNIYFCLCIHQPGKLSLHREME